jgi:hypothetical protein
MGMHVSRTAAKLNRLRKTRCLDFEGFTADYFRERNPVLGFVYYLMLIVLP